MKTTESFRTFAFLVHHVVMMGDDYCPNQMLLRGSSEHLSNQIPEKRS